MKILVIQLRRIGDILLTTPVLPYLKKIFPQSTLDFLCEPMGNEILETNPYIQNLLIYDREKSLSEIARIRSHHYDVVLDFINNPRSAYIVGFSGASQRVAYKKPLRSLFYNVSIPPSSVVEYASLHKLRLVREWLEKTKIPFSPPDRVLPELFFSKEDDQFVEEWLRSENLVGKPFVVMAPIHRHPIRQWRAEGYRNVGIQIEKELGIPVYLSYGPGEENKINQLRKGAEKSLKLLPVTSFRKIGGIYKKAKLMVVNDSGSMHLAVSVGTPTVTIYGPTSPNHLTPPSLDGKSKSLIHVGLTAEGVSCLGCELLDCPVGHLCMTHLTDQTVFESCRELLAA